MLTCEPSTTVPKGRLWLDRVIWVPRQAAERVSRGKATPTTCAATSCCHARMRCTGLQHHPSHIVLSTILALQEVKTGTTNHMS